MPECPSCNKEFSSDMGVKTHHWQVHDEKIGVQDRVCQICGKMFEASDYKVDRGGGKYCSHKCLSESMDSKVTVSCEICGSDKRVKKYQFEKFENHFCSQECYSDYQSKEMVGRGNHMWKEGVEWVPYGPKYYENREKVIERDCGKCIICGDSNIEVHHIKARVQYRENGEILPEANKVENLVTLCRKHHKMYEGKYTDLSANEFKSKVLSQ